MNKVGIKSWGSYLPGRRIQRSAIFDAVAWANPSLKGRAKGTRAFCGWDEDSLTMAVESGRQALKRIADVSGKVSRLSFASTTHPFLDRQNATLLAAALGLPQEIHTTDLSGSLRAATSGLIEAGAIASEADRLLIASDNRHAKPGSEEEMNFGAAAAALVLGEGEVAAEIVGSRSISFDLVDHYRSSGMDTDYGYEARWIRDEGYLGKLVPMLQGFLRDLGQSPGDIDHVILPATSDGLNQALARRLDMAENSVVDGRFSDVGHCGVAHSLLLLSDCLDQAIPGQTILVCGFGQGCDTILFRTTEKLLDMQKRDVSNTGSMPQREVTEYMQFLSFGGQLAMNWGKRSERDDRTAMSSYYRNREALTSFVGGKCSDCGTVQFPRTAFCVNPECNAQGRQEAVSFRELIGRVKTFTEDWQAYCAEPPLKYGHVGFEGGANVLMEFADMPVGTLEVGMLVRPVFRIKDVDRLRRYQRYFWKAAVVQSGNAVEAKGRD